MLEIEIKLKEVNKSDLKFLYQHLKERDPITRISHKKMPTFSEHEKFVMSNPYSKWYIIIKKNKKIDWNIAKTFEGFSDHTIGITAPIVFATLKRQQNSKHILIEKHVKLKESKGPDAATSIDTDELSQLVDHIKIVSKLKIAK